MDGLGYLGAVAALVIVLLLIVASGRLAGHLRLSTLMRTGSGESGVSVGPGTSIDAERRLVIVTWRGCEGLVMLGPRGDLLLAWKDPGVRR